MQQIKSISAEQQSRFPEWVDKWKKIGLSTEPADFECASQAILRAYAVCGLKAPLIILRMGSPLGAVWGGYLGWLFLRAMPRVTDQVRSPVTDQVWNQVGNQVRNQVWDQVGNRVGNRVENQVGSQVRSQVWDQVWNRVRSQVWDQVWNRVGSQVWDQVWNQVGNQVRNQVWDQVGNQVRNQVGNRVWDQVWNRVRSQVWDQVWNRVGSQVWNRVGSQVWDQVGNRVGNRVENQVGSQVWDQVGNQVENQLFNYRGGQFWSHWCAYVTFIRDVLNWEDPILEIFSIEENLTKSCGFIWWHENVVALSDRPARINLDISGRLHCETGPSIIYRDGWGLYHWHGMAVNKEIIEQPETITTAKINAETNLEIKRVMTERYGLEHYIHDSGLKETQADRFGRLFKLPNTHFPVILVKNSTAEPDGTFKNYVLTATRRDVKTAHEAVASTFGLTADQYQPVHES